MSLDFCDLKLEEGYFYSAIRLDKTNLFLSRILRRFHNFQWVSFLKEMRHLAVEIPLRLRAKNSNGIVKGRVSQPKMEEGIEY